MPKYWIKTIALLPVLAGVSILAAGYEQSETRTGPTVRAYAIRHDQGERITIDGLLTEDCWQKAAPATGLRQREPLEGEPATERTEIRLAYDATTLYIGIFAFDSNPEGIISRILQRDKVMQAEFDGRPLFAGDDAVAVLLDPFHDHRNAVVFATNANGAEFDAAIAEEGAVFNIDWRGIWQVASQRLPAGWSTEFAIPFRSLRYPQDSSQPWGFNVYRVIRRKNEEVLWSAWSRGNEGFQRVSRAGHLHGMHGLPRQSFNIELKPFALTGVTRELEDDHLDTEGKLNAGFDAKWELRPGLLLDLTYNTDFAQVESDDEQVNLTRFDLFFPEKREFFLENAGIFEFGYRGFFEPPPFLLFFSRQIGLHEDGEVPVVGGARLSGRIGRQTVGFLDMVTEPAFDQRRTNFAVARVKRDIGGANYVGAIVADRRTVDTTNTAVGLDFSWWPGSALNVQGFVAATTRTGPGGDDHAYRMGVDYGSDHFGFNAQHITVGPEATADVGFITRTDIRRNNGFVRVSARPGRLGLRALNFFWAGTHITNLDFELRDWSSGFAINPVWNSGESLNLFYFNSFTRLDEEFEIHDDLIVPVDDYRDWQFGLFFNTSSSRAIAFSSQNTYQRFFDGTSKQINGALSVALSSNIAFSASFTRNRVDLPWGAFDADLASLRISYAFSTQLFANALLQYNRADRAVSANVRLNFIHRPGSDLFVVYNEGRSGQTDRNSIWDLDNRAAVVKLTYLERL